MLTCPKVPSQPAVGLTEAATPEAPARQPDLLMGDGALQVRGCHECLVPLGEAGADCPFTEGELCLRSWSPGAGVQEEVNYIVFERTSKRDTDYFQTRSLTTLRSHEPPL